MFLDDYKAFEDKDARLTKISMNETTYMYFYRYWVNSLFERVIRLFVWENTYDYKLKEGVKPKEIEQRLILAGHCGITKIIPTTGNKKERLAAMYGHFFGVTEYYDEWTNYTVHCPIYAGKRTIGEDIVIIDNCALRNPLYPLIHHYATLLAHNEVTLNYCLVRLREDGGIPTAKSEIQKRSIQNHQTKIWKGQFSVVDDLGMLGVEYAGNKVDGSQNLMAIMEVREKLIKSFYSDIGVRSAFEKRNNSVRAEVEADTSLLQINISDMIHSREKACEEVNAMFNTNWSVHVAKEIDYGVENERIQFDTETEYHEHDDKEEGEENEDS